ncbi:hypothetical protein JCM10212_005713 [Sporobolomyces blumeae]
MAYPGYPPYEQGAYYYGHAPPAAAAPPQAASAYYGYTPPAASPYPTHPHHHPSYPPRYDGYDYGTATAGGAYAGYAPPPPQQAPPPPQREGELRPPPDVAVDPNSFRRFFSQQLQALTFNSKPIITNLTLFAHEHALRMSGVVAQCLDEHLRSVSPQYVLPAFYLLDSISKNIGPPYLSLFSRFLERAFLSAYHSVDPATKVKLEELLGTWKTGGSDGGELFRGPNEDGRVQRGIETALFGPTGRGGGIGNQGKARDAAESYNNGVQQVPHAATSGERSGVLYDVRRLLSLRQDQAAANPEDQISQGQIIALKKLESLILNTQLTTDQVNQIRSQLATLNPRPASTSTSPPPPSHPPPLPVPTMSPAPPHLPTATMVPSMSPAPPAMSPPPPAAAGPALQNLAAALSPVPQAPPRPTSAVAGVDLSLLSQLSATGALANLFGSSGNATPVPPAVPAMSVKAEGTPLPESKPDLTEKAGFEADQGEDEAARIWQEEIKRLNVNLENADLARSRPNVASLLYVSIPLECQQCGLRFFDSRQGKLKMDEHLDWHFTYKRRVREGAGRAHGRSWFTKEEEWYTSDNASPTFGSSMDPSDPTSSALSPTKSKTASTASSSSIDQASLMKRKVPVPPAGGLGDKPCPICQDKLKSEWSDEEEEWVWWNAVVVEGILYHATCHAEATLARATAAASALARTNSALASQVQSREGTPTSASLKRKVDETKELEAGGVVKGDVGEASGAREGRAVDGEGEGDGERDLKRVKSEPGLEDAP